MGFLRLNVSVRKHGVAPPLVVLVPGPCTAGRLPPNKFCCEIAGLLEAAISADETLSTVSMTMDHMCDI